MTRPLRYMCTVDMSRCNRCLACEETMGGLIEKYAGYGQISEFHIADIDIMYRLDMAMQACPQNAITVELM